MRFLERFFPISTWLPRYKSQYLKGDFFAGLTVGVMLIPQGMAYALIAGLPPVYGLYASIIPQVLYMIFGTSRQLSVGPVAMDSLLVAAGVSVLAIEGSESYITYTILLAGMVGLFQLMLGVFRMGFITNLLSKPLISGFTSAAAFLIGLNQLKYLLGVEVVKSNQFYKVLQDLVAEAGETHLLTLLLGVLGVVIIVGVKKIHPSIPGALFAVFAGVLAVYLFDLQQVGVSVVGDIPEGLPSVAIPVLDISMIREVTPLGLTIAVIAFMESYSVAKALESKKGDHKVNPNQELIALGVSNFGGSFFQSYPVSGGFSRSAVNEQTGANTPLSLLVSATLIGFTLLFFTPLFYFLPEAVLASVIMVAVAGLIDLKYAGQLWHDSKVEFILLLSTFGITLTVGMVQGIVAGIVLSVLVLLYKSAYPHIARLGRIKGHHEFRNVKRFKDLEVWDNLLILRVDAPLTFINIQYFKGYVEGAVKASNGSITSVILDAGPVSYVDATAIDGLRELFKSLEASGVSFLICDLIGPVRDIFHKTGLMHILGKENIFFDLNETVRYAIGHRKGRYKDYALQSNEE